MRGIFRAVILLKIHISHVVDLISKLILHPVTCDVRWYCADHKGLQAMSINSHEHSESAEAG